MLINLPVGSKPTKQPTNYVFCIDVSGSMYSTLRELRNNLKNKIASLIEPKDTLSIIWFSGRDKAGFVFEDLQITSPQSLEAAKQGIDSYLTAQGLTGFRKPIELAGTKVNSNMANVFALFTDGYNNSDSTDSVFAALTAISNKFDAYHFVEYGWYCDSKLIGQLAQLVGGTHSVAAQFQDLELSIENSVKGITSPRVEVASNSTIVYGFDGTDVILYPVIDGKALVSPNSLLLSNTFLNSNSSIMETLIVALGAAIQGQWARVEEAILTLNDPTLITSLTKAYGKQGIQALKDALLAAIKGDLALTPQLFPATIDENAFCVLDLLELLTTCGENYLLTQHPAYQYNRIGRARTTRTAEADKAVVAGAELFGLADISPVKIPYFKAHEGYTGEVLLNKLTFNTERANISLQLRTEGKVVDIPDNPWSVFEWHTQIFRNHTIIQDGILNVPKLPVRVNDATMYKLIQAVNSKVFWSHTGLDEVVFDLTAIPVINRKRIKELNAKSSATKAFELLSVRAALKVLKHFDTSSKNVEGVDPELAAFLKTIGITEMGYSPLTDSVPAVDFYYAPTLEYKFAGASSLPSIKAVKDKEAKIQAAFDAGKKVPVFNLGERLIHAALTMVEGTLSVDKVADFTKKTNARKRALEVELANLTSTIIFSRGWFADKADFDDNIVTLSTKFGEVTCKIDFTDKEEKI